eukprot:maker-scaffold_40-snap-gene-0.5-mRNA-1 protein AED:0.01 eAED:0.01 QI:18/1/1/1/0.5/0.33/3/468/517
MQTNKGLSKFLPQWVKKIVQHETTKPKASENKEIKSTPKILLPKPANQLLKNKLAQHKAKLKEKYTLGEKMGEGSYGTVYFAINKITKEEVAVKSIRKKKVRRSETLVREIKILKATKHQNIVDLYDVYENDTYIHIVMELCRGGELFDYISQKKSFTESESRNFMIQILNGVYYLHEKGIAHRDLKPENFLFKESPEKSKVLKIIDFGLSRFANKDTVMHTRVGTLYYLSPEVISKQYNIACDCWSIGVILYIMLCGYTPFYGETEREMFTMIKGGQFDFPEEEWKDISEEAKDLILKLLELDPDRRLTAKEALQHPWMKLTDTKTVLHAEFVKRLTSFATHNKIKKTALGVIARLLTKDQIKSLRKQFKAIDADGNGTISFVELNGALKTLGLKPDSKDVQRLMKLIDLDGNGKVDYVEFIAATIERHIYLKEELLHRAYEHLAQGNHSQITAETLTQIIGDTESNLVKSVMSEYSTNGVLTFEQFKNLMATPDLVETPKNKTFSSLSVEKNETD